MTVRTESLWLATHQLRRAAPLARPLDTDVAIVGGGISGLTAAVALAREGRSVVLLEKDAIGGGETGHTTSHLTEAIDARYRAIITQTGEEGARLVARASREAIDWIDKLGRIPAVDTGFARVPGFLYAESRDAVDELADELDAARRAGCAVSWVDQAPLPFANHGGIRWEAQAQVHATAYLEALLHDAQAHGVRLYDQTRVTGVEDGEPCRVETERGEVRARAVFVAANVPVNNRVFLHTKIAAYRSYALAAAAPPLAPGLYWDTASPYHYTRTQTIGDRSYLIVGGEDHRTGMDEDTEARYGALVDYARSHFGVTDVRYRWSGQIIEPVDGLPFIGANTASTHVFVATGYSGNGITFGTVAGLIVADLILQRPNPYADLFTATRVPVSAAKDYVQENAAFPAHLVADRLTAHDVADQAIETLAPGEGGVYAGPDGKVAVCRDRRGHLHAVSAVCTHLGCDVAWNRAEQTWDCPCHGSRFTPDGHVVNGPAVTDLPPKPVRDLHPLDR